MKAKTLLLLCTLTTQIHAQAQNTTGTANVASASNAPATYSVTERGPHNRVWQRVLAKTINLGEAIYYTNAYQEMATGICYWNGSQWVDSSDQIQLTQNGAAATNTQHRVSFSADINTSGAINLATPDGKQMTSQVLGLAYTDASTGNGVLFAEIQDSIGQLLPSGNQVLYTNAFTNADCDVLYTHKLAGFEQDIIIRQQLPSPASCGLNGSNIWLQVWTEFTAAPSPQITHQQNGSDNFLDFGAMKMGPGRAFMLGGRSNTVPVVKQWVSSQGRTFLVESVLLNAISAKLAQLPAPSGSSGNTNSAPGSGSSGTGEQSKIHSASESLASLAPPLPNFKSLILPSPKPAKKSSATMSLAVAAPNPKGVVLDYYTFNGSQTDFTFQSDTTYFVTNEVDLSGTTTIEGGTVIKYSANGTETIIPADLVWKTGLYRPAIFTGMDDDSVGMQICGSSGDPTEASYGFIALNLSICDTYLVSNARFSFLNTAVAGNYFYCATIRDVQFNQCQTVIAGDSQGIDGEHNFSFYNVLAWNIGTFIGFDGDYGGQSADCQNCTIDGCGQFFVDNTSIANLYNCIAAGVGWNAYEVNNNNSAVLGDDTGVFQSVGAGNFYLATTNYQGIGTGSIDGTLLADLGQSTTWPPIVYANTNLSANLILTNAVPRDTSGSPDLGYHYPAVDYAFGAVSLTDATLTNMPGTVIAGFDTNGSGYSLAIGPGGQFLSQGTPTSLSRIINFNTVQEQFGSGWTTPTQGLLIPNGLTNDPPSVIDCRFTDFSILAKDTAHFYGIAGNTAPINFQDCQFHGGSLTSTNPTINLTNCLLERVAATLWSYDGLAPQIRNNLFWVGSLDLEFSATTSLVQNNLFDQTTINDHGITDYVGTFNGYVTSFDTLTLTDGNDVFLSSALNYQVGQLGNYYQPCDSPLTNMGSTNAGVLGLYHYTTHTNEVPQSNSIVDIGYHYVALNASGNPIDANSNGIPDYLENPYGTVFPCITTQPATQVALVGSNVTFSVVAVGVSGDAPLTYQWKLNGTNIAGATTCSYTTNNVQLGDDGVYTVAVTNFGGSVTSTNTYLNVLSNTIPTNGLQFWVRADFGLVTNGTGAVSVWHDVSGNGNDASQTDPDYQPQWTGALFSNGMPAVHFTATNNDVLGFNEFLSGTNPAEVFIILRVVTNQPCNSRGLWRIGNSSLSGPSKNDFFQPKYAKSSGYHLAAAERLCGVTDGGQEAFYPTTNGSIQDDFATSEGSFVGIPAQDLRCFHLYNVVSTKGGWTNRINGLMIFATAENEIGYNQTGSQFLLGESADSYFDGDIAEVLIYGSQLTQAQRVSIGNYLTSKYSLVNGVPATPTNLTVTALSPSQINITWNSGLSNAPFFILERSATNASNFNQIGFIENAQSYIDTGLSPATAYFYRISAGNYVGNSGVSSTNNATTLSAGTDLPLSSLQFWLKGDAGHQTDCGPLPLWLDQSGNAYYAYQMDNITNQPTATNEAANNHTTVHFTACSNNFMYFDPPPFLSGTAPAEAFIVLRAVSAMPTDSRGLWWIGGQSYYPDNNGNIQDSFGSTTPFQTGQPVQPITNFHLYNVVSTGNGWTNRLNGVTQYATNVNTVSYSPTYYEFYLGASPSFDGDMAEVMIFDRALTEAERTAVGRYIQGRYAIVCTPNLPQSGILALGQSPTQMLLSLSNAVNNFASLTVERMIGVGGTYIQIAEFPTIPPSGLMDTITSSAAEYFYRFTAYDYAGDSTNIVIAPPTVVITNPATATPISLATNIPVNVSASDPFGTVSEVDLCSSSVVLFSMTNSPYNFDLSTTNAIYFALTAVATDNAGNTRISTPVYLPVYTNTSGDGRNDGLDIALGLDPSSNSAPPFNPSNTTPPVINLLLPTNATPVP